MRQFTDGCRGFGRRWSPPLSALPRASRFFSPDMNSTGRVGGCFFPCDPLSVRLAVGLGQSQGTSGRRRLPPHCRGRNRAGSARSHDRRRWAGSSATRVAHAWLTTFILRRHRSKLYVLAPILAIVGDDGARQTLLGFETRADAAAWIAWDKRPNAADDPWTSSYLRTPDF